ncbi:tetratricopeptide repeat protein [Clostridium cylindrosporum]|uniref:Uncharacterized protein n=1 Tax=Clostridium cylindrosporum DSM 605 TaxID=1121307 RepID=A0A0J8DCV5_CLOCY|nr:tetratricopeptide repeat protein [Clostridium cylindrosporum]KMT22089.1 hypothetical protein CLCY_4c00620 [Clostridium cylindrosporum DSM 605]
MVILNMFKKRIDIIRLIKEAKSLINNREYNYAIEIMDKALSINNKNYDALVTRARAYCYLEIYDKALIDLNSAIDLNTSCTNAFFYRGQINIINNNLYEALDDFSKVISVDRRNSIAYMKRGSIYSKLGMYDAAVNNFKALVRIKRRDHHSYDLLLSACLAAKRYDEVEGYSQKLIIIHEESPRGYYYLGRLYSLKGYFKESVKYLTDAIRRDGSNAEYYYHRGMDYIQLMEYSDAIVDFTMGIKINSGNSSEFYFSRGYSYLSLKEYENAIRDFDKLIELGVNTKSAYYNKATAYLNMNMYSEAILCLNKVIEEDESFQGAFYDRAFCYKQLGDYEKAIVDYEKALEINPKYDAFYYELTRVYFDKGDFDKVLETLDRAEKSNPNWPYKTFAYTLKGDIYYNKKHNLDDSIENYTKSIDLSPTAYAYIQRGRCYQDKNEYELSIKDFDFALEIDSKNASAYFRKAISYEAMENMDKAIEYYSLAIENSKDSMKEVYYNSRGCCYGYMKDYENAIIDFKEAINISPSSKDAYGNLALAYKAENDIEKAIECYENIIKIDSNDENIYYSIATLYLEIRKYKEAKDYFTLAINVNPNLEEAFYYRGYINYFHDYFEEAIDDLNASINLEETSTSILLRGRCYLESKKYLLAIDDFSYLISREEEAVYYTYRGMAFYFIGELQSAIDDYNSAIEIDNNDAETYSCRADAFKKLKMYENAIKDYRKSGEINNKYKSGAYCNIGIIYSETEESKKAMYYYNKSIGMNFKNYMAYLKRAEELEKNGEYEEAVNDIENLLVKSNYTLENIREKMSDIEKILNNVIEKTSNERTSSKVKEMLEILYKHLN